MVHPPRFGKFEVRRVLGHGAQSVVYLAHDPDLRREVAIKWLKTGGHAAETVRREAQTVGPLRHPHIASIYELGEHEGRTYLVFEYIAGPTLEQALAKDGAMTPRRAAELMVTILGAVKAAHEQGVIHRDLKPSNILLDSAGTPHVMDFGIATRPADASGLEPDLLGSPAYMAPEYIKQRVVSEQYDVFSAGLILYEIVFGRRAVQGEHPFQALHQIANVPLSFPSDSHGRIGAQLQDVIAKATVKEPELRYTSARQMQQALEVYLHPELEQVAGGNTQQSTLEFLMRRMKVKGDFPAMSAAINAIQRMAASDKANVNSLSNSILKDFALTNKILRLVNSAYYANRSGERIRTVSRAIVMLGFDAVRSIAISLMLFDRIRDKAHSDVLKEEFLRTNLSGILARELCAQVSPTQSEEAFICALFHHLGRLLTYFYFWEEAEMIRRLMANENSSEEAAAIRVLGITYTDLGVGVAQSWGFPSSITQSMRAIADGKVPKPANADDRLHQVSALANEICCVLDTSEAPARSEALSRLAQRYGAGLTLSSRDFDQAVQRSVTGVTELADTLGIHLKKSALGKRICPAEAAPAASTAPGPKAANALRDVPADSELVEAQEHEDAGGSGTEAILSAGIQDISRALLEEMPVSDVLRIVAETIFRAIDVRCVLICTRDGRQNSMIARFGFGAEVDDAVRRFVFPLAGTDLFNAILKQDNAVLIRDAAEAKVRSRLPTWYLQHVNAPSFVVFPMNIRNVPVAMIYADQDKPGAITFNEKQLALLHTLRNQALLAIKQSL